MTDTTTLITRTPGDTFRFRGTEYVLIDFARTKAKIAALTEPGKVYTLARTATVEPTGHSDDALAAALQATAARAAEPDPRNPRAHRRQPRTTRDGLAGVETLIVRTNPKSYTLANGWRVSPGLVEAV
ncbi:hypothetical protein AB1285_26915 [Microbacterium sp. NRRL B-14842]|uniref:hypothetical protein n=1 Tax=Microbacterium sp. NRRL B-14842 TaxID=3162881 RepID=UPI003D2B7857